MEEETSVNGGLQMIKHKQDMWRVYKHRTYGNVEVYNNYEVTKSH